MSSLKLSALCALLFSLTIGCNNLEFSPNQSFDRNSPIDLNAKNIAKLNNNINNTDDTVRFILTGDTQRSYDQARAMIAVVNKNYPKLNFVLLNGDISDFGLLQEMEWVTKIYEDLKAPYITVIGNHDLVANGLNTYKRMFGPLNFSFIFKKVKFILHDNNGREYNFNGKIPDLDWISKEIQTDNSVNAIVAVGHIPPTSTDYDAKLKDGYETLLNSNSKVVASFHAHENTNKIHFADSGPVPFITSNAVTNREFLYVEIANGKLLKYDPISY
ncbi:metallophosphoesterase family protein [Pedobacter alpinus]|uniref:Metallophosphoesterase family protein n=1 Tax=Pedobacter alpinus TaxID=1590643 RepID=A0ABW5TX95_9SPHI